MLTFVIDNHASGLVRDWMMVESGMQQQAIALVCAALGVGMLFRGLGENGAAVSDTEYATVKVKLDAMKPTYDGSFWSSLPPAGTKSWLRGNLPDPARDGNEPLISVLENMKIENRSGRNSTDESVSQFLWAARGRTPHFYKSRPWGMAVPTSGGEQNASSVYLIRDDKLFKYVNWHKNRPTHSLETLGKIDLDVYNQLMRLFPFHNSFIVIGKNIDFATALLEVGYQLLNLVLQAQALCLGYEAVLLDENHKKAFRSVGIKDPVCTFALRQRTEQEESV